MLPLATWGSATPRSGRPRARCLGALCRRQGALLSPWGGIKPYRDAVGHGNSEGEPAAGYFRPLGWPVLLALVAGLVTVIADLYASPLCGQTFTRLYSARFLVPSLLFAALLSAIPVMRTLRTARSTSSKVVVAAACTTLIMAMPAVIAVASLHDPVRSGVSTTCEDH